MFWELHTAELQPTGHAEQFASLEDWLCEGSAVALVRRSLPRSFPKQSSGLVRHGITTVLRNDPSNSRDSLKSVFPLLSSLFSSRRFRAALRVICDSAMDVRKCCIDRLRPPLLF